MLFKIIKPVPIAAFFFLSCAWTMKAQIMGIKRFAAPDEYRNAKITCLYKGHNGYIYTGTTNGLYRFDGIRYTPIEFSTSHFNDTVTALFEDLNGRLWTGYNSGRIAYLLNDHLVYFNPEEGLPKKRITGLLSDAQNNLWFSSSGEGIYYMQDSHMHLLDETDGLIDLNINCIAICRDGNVLAGTDQGLFVCSVNGSQKKIRAITPKNGLPDYIVTCIEPAGNDRYWIGLQDKGFCLYDHTTEKIHLTEATKSWQYGQVNSILFSENNLWIATSEGGLINITDSGSRLRLVAGFGKVKNLLLDNEGNTWMAMQDSLTQTAGNKLRLIPLYNSRLFETIHTIFSDYQGNIWAGTNGGLIKYAPGNNGYTSKEYKIAGLDASTDITSLYQDMYHTLWVGTMGRGVLIMNPETGAYRSLSENPLLKDASILSISGNGNTVCAGGLEGVAMIFELGENNLSINNPYHFTNYNNIPNIGNNYIYNVFKDSRGRIWFGTNGKGITVLENGQFHYFSNNEGLSVKNVLSFTEDNNGMIWFGSEDEGIFSFDGKVFRNYSSADGISDMKTTNVKTDRSGNIIIAHKKGIDILNPANGNISYINNTQGIPELSTDMGTVTRDQEGNILFTSIAGILEYSSTGQRSSQPFTILENIQLFGSMISPGPDDHFSHDENSFTFNFTGLYYTQPDAVHFQYKLEGYDTSWKSTNDRSKSFAKLEPGKYTFRVRSSLNENFSNAHESAYTFVIEKAIWKRFWFIGLCILVSMALLYWYIKSRERDIQHLQKLQQEKIQFQFQVLRNQVNPHFLFNSFNTLISTIEEDPKTAVQYVEHLSDFFRNIVNYRDTDIISLGEELALLNTYFFLQQKRYGSYLSLHTELTDQERSDTFIPPLTLQLLVENAIKHNAVSSETPLYIEITTTTIEYIEISNNINPKTSQESGAGMGLQNIINRYALLTKDPVRVHNNNINFIVSLPMLKK